MNICLNDTFFELIEQVAFEENVEAFVIGGFVRDRLLKRESSKKDIDIVVTGSGIDFARKVAKSLPGKPKVTVFRTYGTAMFNNGETEIEFVGARKESYSVDSRNPSVTPGTIEDDQLRRDFTINALAISLNKGSYGDLIDPFNGLGDLKDKIIRTPLEPEKTFSDDPLRMLRAIRFATQLNFEIEEKTFNALSDCASRLEIITGERISSELNKIISSKTPGRGILLLESSGLLKMILPEMILLKGVEEIEGKGHKDIFLHTLEVLDNLALVSDDLWLRWSALLHDIGKPGTKKFDPKIGWTFHGHDHLGKKIVPIIFKRLKLPLNDRMKFVQKMVALHLRPIVISMEEVTDSAVRRLLYDTGNDIDELMMLCEADITSKNQNRRKKHLQNFKIVRKKLKEIEEKDATRIFQPPIDGSEIMKTFDLAPSAEVGIIKSAIKEAILDGSIPNEYNAARRFMIDKGIEIGLTPVISE